MVGPRPRVPLTLPLAKSVKGKQTVHYWRLKRYDILNIGGEEKLRVPLSAEKKRIPLLYYF